MQTIMMSIRASEAEKIVTGRKNYEYRTRRPKQDVDYVVLYENAPVSAIRYILKITNILTPSEVLCDGIDQNNAFHNEELRYRFAYQIDTVWECCEKIDKMMLKNKFHITPPRSFLYLNSDDDLSCYLKSKSFLKKYHYYHFESPIT